MASGNSDFQAVSGEVPGAHTQGSLLVANHVSWADIHAINSVFPVRFVAKAEIKDWPVFGFLGRKCGTIFINRTKNRDAVRVIDIATQALQQHDNLCVFPEGTTSEGLSVLPFKSSLLQTAISTGCPLIPLTIRYPLPDGKLNLEAAYAGDTTLFESMRAYLYMRRPQVTLHFGTPVTTHQLSRQALAEQLQATILLSLQSQV